MVMLSPLRQTVREFPLARFDQHLAQLPDALGVVGQRHAVLGLLQLECAICRMVVSVSSACMASAGLIDAAIPHPPQKTV
jgi:hypothetical protein